MQRLSLEQDGISYPSPQYNQFTSLDLLVHVTAKTGQKSLLILVRQTQFTSCSFHINLKCDYIYRVNSQNSLSKCDAYFMKRVQQLWLCLSTILMSVTVSIIIFVKYFGVISVMYCINVIIQGIMPAFKRNSVLSIWNVQMQTFNSHFERSCYSCGRWMEISQHVMGKVAYLIVHTIVLLDKIWDVLLFVQCSFSFLEDICAITALIYMLHKSINIDMPRYGKLSRSRTRAVLYLRTELSVR